MSETPEENTADIPEVVKQLQQLDVSREEYIQLLVKENQELRRKKEQYERDVSGISTHKYFEEGSELPELSMVGSDSGPSTNKKHLPIDRTELKQFGHLLISPEDVAHCRTRTTHIFESWETSASTETDIRNKVLTVLKDMIVAAKVGESLKVYAELTIAELRTDFWVFTVGGFPIGVVGVTKPGLALSRDWNVNYGQLYDYLLRTRSFHGIRNVIGIFTNWDDWVFGWLPDSDQSALATSLEYDINNNVTFSSPTTDRALHTSQRYSRKDLKSLSTALVSWLKKLVKNSRNVAAPVVPLVHEKRSYILMTENKWVWTNGISTTNLSLEPPRRNTKSFYLLRDVHGGADGRVWLACHVERSIGIFSAKQYLGKLAVLKFLAPAEQGERADRDKEKAAAEVKHWHALGITSVYQTVLSKRHVIVIPFGFHFKADRTIDTSWWNPLEAHPPIVDFNTVYTLAQEADSAEVLGACVEACAKKKLVHSDIHWRHVAMFPSKNQPLFSNTHKWTLRFCFIDLSQMEKSTSSQEARAAMTESMEQLLL